MRPPAMTTGRSLRAGRRAIPTALLTALMVVGVACGGGSDGGPGEASSGDVAADASPDGAAPSAVEVPPLHPSVDDWPTTAVTVTGQDGERHRLATLVADTPERRRHGLMEVPRVPDGVGMLFPFGEPRSVAFTMRNTLTGLDIAFADGEGRIVDVVTLDPCPSGENCDGYAPEGEIADVLEVRAGWFAEQGLGVGARLDVAGRGLRGGAGDG